MAAIDPRDEQIEELRLYGVPVKAAEYGQIKGIADRLAQCAYADIPKSRVQRKAVELAIAAVRQMKEWNRHQ